MLHLYGKEHPQSGLDKKVKGLHFSQNIDIIDPVLKVPDKKPAKHFMINQTQLLFDRDRIMLSPFDDLLYRQFINYSVLKVTQNGTPIFTSTDEHALDAFMMSILAFTIELPDIAETISKPQKILEISTIKNNPISQAASSLFDRVNKSIERYKQEEYNDDLKCDRPPNIIKRNDTHSGSSASKAWASRGTSRGHMGRRSF